MKFALIAAMLLAVGLGLTGCVAAPTGRTAAATDRQIESVAGVKKASASSANLLDGLTSSQIVGITVTVSDGYRVGDADAVIVWLAQEGWSLGPRRPDGIGITLEDSSGKPLNWGWKATLVKRGWDSRVVDEDMNSGGQLILSASDMTSVAGKTWPGKVPSIPADVLVKN